MSETINIDIVENKGSFKALPEMKTFSAGKLDKSHKPATSDRDSHLSRGDWARWGEDDKLPARIRESIYKTPIAGTALSKLVAMMYGNGLVYVKTEDLHDADTDVRRAYIPEVEKFLQDNHIRTKHLPAKIADYRFYMNTFSEFILNPFRDKVIGLYHKSAEFCRLERNNEKTLNIDHLYYSAGFTDPMLLKKDEIKKIPLFQWQDPEWFQNFRGNKFAYHAHFPTPGIKYYARPWWLGLFDEDGWMEVSQNVPKIIKAMQRNQARIRYQVQIPESYFEIRWPKWQTYDMKEREKLIDEVVKKLNNELTDTKNAYKTMTTLFRQDAMNREVGKVEIVAVDDKIKRDSWVPDANTSDAQIVQALGLHPSQAGLQPQGGKMGAGSGSDQRESYNTQINNNTIDQAIILEDLNLVSKINRWNVTFMIDHTYHTTTNNKEDGLVNSSTGKELV